MIYTKFFSLTFTSIREYLYDLEMTLRTPCIGRWRELIQVPNKNKIVCKFITTFLKHNRGTKCSTYNYLIHKNFMNHILSHHMKQVQSAHVWYVSVIKKFLSNSKTILSLLTYSICNKKLKNRKGEEIKNRKTHLIFCFCIT